MRDPCILHPVHFKQQRAVRREALAEKAVFPYLFNNSHRKQLFVYEGLQQLSMELKHLKPSKAFRPDYYMRVFPQPARADYPTCYNRCQLIFLSLPAVCAAGLQAIFRIIADVNL